MDKHVDAGNTASRAKPGTMKACGIHTGQARIIEVSPASLTVIAPAHERQATSAPNRPTSSEPKASITHSVRCFMLWVKKSTLMSPCSRWQ
jgi:hypothetical protein